jgi:hypothetical protein
MKISILFEDFLREFSEIIKIIFIFRFQNSNFKHNFICTVEYLVYFNLNKTITVLCYQLLNKKELYFEKKNRLRFHGAATAAFLSFFPQCLCGLFKTYCHRGFLAPWFLGIYSFFRNFHEL